MTRNVREICHLLQQVRDWGNHMKPFNAIMCLVALQEAGELGLSSRRLGTFIGRGSDHISATLAPWVKAGLIEFEKRTGPRSRIDPGYYRITPEGRVHADALFREPIPAKA